MDKFYANTLIVFLKHQQLINYRGINQVLDIIDNDDIPENYKRDFLFAVLHKYGLHEEGHCDGNFRPDAKAIKEFADAQFLEESAPLEAVILELSGGDLEIRIYLN